MTRSILRISIFWIAISRTSKLNGASSSSIRGHLARVVGLTEIAPQYWGSCLENSSRAQHELVRHPVDDGKFRQCLTGDLGDLRDDILHHVFESMKGTRRGENKERHQNGSCFHLMRHNGALWVSKPWTAWRRTLKIPGLQVFPYWHIFCSTPAHAARLRAIIVPMEQSAERSTLPFISSQR